MCLRACRPNALPKGGGCWTCETKRLCESARAAPLDEASSSSWAWLSRGGSACEWNDSLDLCESRVPDREPSGVYEGDVINPSSGLPAFTTAVGGTVAVERTDWEDMWQLEDMEYVSGHLILSNNENLKSVDLHSMQWIGGDVELVNNPTLEVLNMGENVVVSGCVRVWNCPRLKVLGGLRGVPRCGGGIGADAAV